MIELTKEEMQGVAGGKIKTLMGTDNSTDLPWYGTLDALETSNLVSGIKNMIKLKKSQGVSLSSVKSAVYSTYGAYAPQDALSAFVDRWW